MKGYTHSRIFSPNLKFEYVQISGLDHEGDTVDIIGQVRSVEGTEIAVQVFNIGNYFRFDLEKFEDYVPDEYGLTLRILAPTILVDFKGGGAE